MRIGDDLGGMGESTSALTSSPIWRGMCIMMIIILVVIIVVIIVNVIVIDLRFENLLAIHLVPCSTGQPM